MKIYTIYKATNIINGKIYIGFDSKWPARQKAHKVRALYPKSHTYYFHNAIRKHGWHNFQWEVIYQSLDNIHCLSVMETYFIKEYNSFYLWEKGGYNLTLGGEGSLGSKWPESKYIKMSGENHTKHWLGKKRLDISEIMMGNTKSAKDWIFIDPEGIKYKVFNSNKFCKEHNLDSGNMTRVAQGERKHYKGWKCEYA